MIPRSSRYPVAGYVRVVVWFDLYDGLIFDACRIKTREVYKDFGIHDGCPF